MPQFEALAESPAATPTDCRGKNPHDHHVHISVPETKSRYDSTAAWTIA